MRFAIFVHDADGDSGYGQIIGAFETVRAAEDKAEAIRRAGGDSLTLECIVLPVYKGSKAARTIVDEVLA